MPASGTCTMYAHGIQHRKSLSDLKKRITGRNLTASDTLNLPLILFVFTLLPCACFWHY
jgi:hypothetical protein